ncbi:MAG TPA: hypothetical protein VEA69_12630 [Tepidisphaeraceae bacterium]|nr:hypothetical protein [Tepidisphaeraceae bacterium]
METAPPKPRRPVKVIGGRGAEPVGGPDAYPIIDRLIDEGAPTWQIKAHFASRAESLHFVSSRLAAAHAPARAAAAGNCSGCSAELAGVLGVIWEYWYRPKEPISWGHVALCVVMAHLPLSTGEMGHRFVTHHRLCPSCARAARSRIRVAKFVRALGWLLLAVGPILATIVAVSAGMSPVRPHDWTGSPVVGWGGAAMAVAAVTLLLLGRRFRVHPVLAKVGRPEFRPVKAVPVTAGVA